MDASATTTSRETPGQPTAPPESGARWPDRLWLLVCMTASSLWCISAASHIGPTFDEPNYVVNGLERWRSGSYGQLMRQGTMPLPVDVISFPLHIWEELRGTPFGVGLNEAQHPNLLDDLPVLLPVARLGTLLFWWLLLLYAWRIGWTVGRWGGRLAVTLTACEPNLLAHATLATTDIAATACLLMLVYHFATGRTSEWRRRVLVPGVLFGVALLAKASALVFWPLCWVGIEVHRLWPSEQRGGLGGLRAAPSALRAAVRDGWQIALIGLTVAFLYVGVEFRPEDSFVAWAHSLPEGTLSRCMTFAADNLRIFPNAGEGLVYQIKHNIRGHGVYVLGQTHHRALWYYFPIALAIKLSLGSLLLLPAAALFCRGALKHWAVAAVAALMVFSVVYRVQIGIRLVLPVVALLVIGGGVAVAFACRHGESVQRRRLCAALAVMATAWGGFSALHSWPHALAYTNEVFDRDWHGGPALCDSNIDWGQGLVELDEWRRERGLPEVDVWYFGTDPAIHRAPFRSALLHHVNVTNRDELIAKVRGNLLAVSTTLLYGPDLGPQHAQSARILREMRPVDRTTTFFIFDLAPTTPESAVADGERSTVLR